MKQKSLWMLSALLLAGSNVVLTGCKPNSEDFIKQPEIVKLPYSVTDQDRVKHAEQALGITIDPQQDWTLTNDYRVTITADADLDGISKVMVIDGDPYLKPTQILAVKSIGKDATATLTFRAGKTATMLYAACIAGDGQCIARPFVPGEDGEVSFADRIPTTAMAPGADNTISPTDDGIFYKKDFISFRDAVLKLLPKGQDNRSVLGDLDYTSTIQVRKNPYTLLVDLPLAFMCGDGSASDNLSYTWYPEGKTEGIETFLNKDTFDGNSDVPVYDRPTKEWALKGCYLQCRQSDNTIDKLFTPGDILTFRLANDEVLLDDTPSPRVKVFMLNGYVFLACEDGNDWDYNDRMFWMPEGADRIEKAKVVPVDPEPMAPQTWTYAWEDRDFGDYDLNDCVIEVQEQADDNTKLVVKLVALGGARNLWLGFENKSAKDYRDYKPVFQKELHEVLGVPAGSMVNTGRTTAEPVTIVVDKPAGFDFQTCSFVLGCKFSDDQQGVYQSDYYAIHIATKGQDPHGIVIPGKWQWPTETTAITKAYPKFREWAKDVTNTEAQDWYLFPAEGKVVK